MGELLDRTAAMWRMHMWPLFALSFALQLSSWATGKYFTFEFARLLPTGADGPPPDLASMFGVVKMVGWMILLFLLYWWMANSASLASAHYMLARTIGGNSTVGAALRRLWQRFGALSGVLVLSLFYGLGYQLVAAIPIAILVVGVTGLAAFAGLSQGAIVLLMIPTVGVAMLLMFGALLIWVLRFMLASQVLAAEEVGVFGALRRSGELLSGRLGEGFLGRVKVRATIVVSVMWILILAVTTTAQIPVFILQAIFHAPDDPFGVNLELGPRLVMTIAELAGVVGSALFAPLSIVLATLFYVDMRVRREGWDLELKLDRPGVA